MQAEIDKTEIDPKRQEFYENLFKPDSDEELKKA